ncbi:MAG: Gfo/Idh/MocA family oxidoreductase [Hyphomicrobiales bacterium]
MNLMAKLAALSADNKQVRAGVIGAGKFGSMFLNQVPTTPGLTVTAIADLSPDRAIAACKNVGWDDARIAATDFIEDGAALCARDDVDVVLEITGSPAAGIAHALAAFENGKHIIMVNVEADVLAGAALAKRAASAGVVYSMAYGDQPALTSEIVDWARASGFKVVAAGKGTKYLPAYHAVTPDDVWTHYGLTSQEADAAGMNPQMFNSFLDGTKSSIEMCAIANACDLRVPENGLLFPPCGVDDLHNVLRPKMVGGVLEKEGMAEVVSSLERDGSPVYRDLRWGVYVVFEAPNDYAAACFKQYGMNTDDTGRYASLYRPYHLIGLELGISALNTVLRHEATGTTRAFNGDAVAVAKRVLKAGETLDGEGGYTVWGRACPAIKSKAMGALPIGLAYNMTLKRDVALGDVVTFEDVNIDEASLTVKIRREAEALI